MNRIRRRLDHLTSREKIMIFGLLITVITIVIFLYFFFTISASSDIELQIEEGKITLASLDKKLLSYLKRTNINDKLKEQIVHNPIKSLRIPINNIAKAISYESNYGKKYLNDVIKFEGKIKEKKITFGKKKLFKKSMSHKGFWQIEQDVDFSSIPVEAFYEFISKLSSSEKILFITKLDALRKYNNPKQVRVSLTVGTIKYIKEEDGE